MSTVTPTSTSKQHLLAGAKKASKAERINTALRAALYMHEDSTERWRALRDEGADNNQIWQALLEEFGTGGSSQTEGGDQFAYQGGNGAAQPKFWFSQGTHYTNEKPTLAGARLVKRVRELLEIPEESQSRAVLSKLESGQRGRWATLCEYIGKRNQKRLKSEREDVLKESEAASEEAVSALSGNADAVQEVRDRVEMPPASDETLIDMLGLISITVDLPTVQSWTPEQRRQAESYAAAVHLKAGDHDDVKVPPRPEFLPAEVTPATEDAPASKTFSTEIEVELSDADYKAKSRQLAFLRLQIEELQAEKKQTDDSYKQKIGGLEEQCAEIFTALRRGRDTLELEVFERRDYEREVVETRRADSGAVVAERAMNPSELQQPLPTF